LASDFGSLLSAREIAQWRDRTLHWYGDTSHDPACAPVHIHLSNTQAFIEQAALEIAGLLSIGINLKI
jgi:hypothetical protein